MDMVLAVVGLFVLRLGVPLALMVLLSWAINRYIQRQEAREGAPEIMFEEVPLETAPLPGLGSPSKERCWDAKGCTEAQMESCPAAKRPELPCWLAKQLATGALSEACRDCSIYSQGLAALRAPGAVHVEAK